jgi:hypothetical protein
MKKLLALVLVAAMGASMVGCGGDSADKTKKAGDDAKKAATEAGEKMKEAGDKMKEAGEKVKEEADKAIDKAKEATTTPDAPKEDAKKE